ncbi:carbohydrate ABC transporter permease [Primorskyibacter aestuariivivens]|uniref:carbohydrate ABC transporter permease n=1 Tax=Primorskyibacter aestuariivivens TaxID=1888912 RepID=UPI002300A21B|nr:carbohydrate ABC transporter permease [Primorskyibacter aestuariivivens]MDA7429106.1 carbohydrate ABC transporter permease [Primorskyibacter aestuariivivens]
MARAVPKTHKLLFTIIGWTVGGIIFFPVLWIILTSFKSHSDVLASPPVFLNFEWTMDAYRTLWDGIDIRRYLLNSIMISLGSTIAALLVAIPAAWSMAFTPSNWTKAILLGMLATKMIPAVALLMPVFLITINLGLLDTRFGLGCILMLINLPIVIWMLFSFFRDIPLEILEAARMDGASPLKEIALILMPLSWPAIMSTFALAVILSWNESFWVLNFTASEAGTMSAFLASYSNSPYWAQISAASVVAILPIMVLGWLCQMQIVRGLTFGAIR